VRGVKVGRGRWMVAAVRRYLWYLWYCRSREGSKSASGGEVEVEAEAGETRRDEMETKSGR
jgi:hypothetical protein